MVFLFMQKSAYGLRSSDWSSDVCSSDLLRPVAGQGGDAGRTGGRFLGGRTGAPGLPAETSRRLHLPLRAPRLEAPAPRRRGLRPGFIARSEEHTSELQSLMRISYAVFCLKKKNNLITKTLE